MGAAPFPRIGNPAKLPRIDNDLSSPEGLLVAPDWLACIVMALGRESIDCALDCTPDLLGCLSL